MLDEALDLLKVLRIPSHLIEAPGLWQAVLNIRHF